MQSYPQEELYPEDLPRLPPNLPGPTSDSVYADYVQEKKAENILAQINPDRLLAEISERIKGRYKDIYTEQWVQIEGAPQVSPLLVGNFISFLSAFLNNSVTLSNFREKEINNIMKAVIQYVVDDLRSNSEKYQIGSVRHRRVTITYADGSSKSYIESTFTPNYSEMTRIGLIVCMSTFSTLKRALNGLESLRIFRIMKIGEMNSPYAGGGGGTSEGGMGSFKEALKFWK